LGGEALVCRSAGVTQAFDGAPATLLRPQDRTIVGLRRLGDLPKARMEIAIARTVAGCAVPVGVRYDVEGDGRFAKGSGR
jgi:hypothetical protein